MNDPLLNKDFLKKLDVYNHREVFAKIVSLDFHENPVAEIQGSVVSGTINVDGSSTVRRTCNITLTNDQYGINEKDWSIKTKIRVYMGLRNYIDTENYDEIIWFPQGVFVISSFNQSYNTSGQTITVQGKDKMCLLNGDIGGNLFASHDFGGIWTVNEDESTTREDIPIKDIIREAVHTYALEDYAHIIINDLDGWSVDLLDFKAKNMTLWVYELLLPNTGVWEANIEFSSGSLGEVLEEKYNDPKYTPNYNAPGAEFEYNGQIYRIIKKVEYGETAGYRPTTLIYPDELVISAGGTITQMLDKIVAMLGEYEYFYNLDGMFVFQRKKIYYNVSWNNAITNSEDNETYFESSALASSIIYDFKRGTLVESFQNKPEVNQIKNDFAIWGKLKGTTTEIPIHLRYAIDTKPLYYYSFTNKQVYIAREAGGQYDWRELIYQMARDDLAIHGQLETNRQKQQEEGWNNIVTSQVYELTKQNAYMSEEQARESYYEVWNTGYDAYYADMLAFWPRLYRTSPAVISSETANDFLTEAEYNEWKQNGFWNPRYVSFDSSTGIAKLVNPEELLFWIDFIDNNSDLNQYKVELIGRRSKVVNDDKVRAICYRDTPSIMFYNANNDEVNVEDMNLSYTKINLPDALVNYFKISTQGKSAKTELDNLVYKHTYYQNSITLSAIPVYYLEPNNRISVYDEMSGIDGEYIIKSISYSLAYDGMMTINATKAENRIL